MAKKQGVIIESRKTGEQYGVSVGDFKKHYEGQGFKIVSNEDGSKYIDPETAAKMKADAEEKAAAKAEAEAKAKADAEAGANQPGNNA
jgi:hypothetical protein